MYQFATGLYTTHCYKIEVFLHYQQNSDVVDYVLRSVLSYELQKRSIFINSSCAVAPSTGHNKLKDIYIN